jgi:hypothetical protein
MRISKVAMSILLPNRVKVLKLAINVKIRFLIFFPAHFTMSRSNEFNADSISFEDKFNERSKGMICSRSLY